jgi:hypothetical protein
LACGLRRFSNDLMELGGEGVEDPGHHDVVQSSPIDGWIGDVREEMVIEGVATKREKHEVVPPLVVGRQGFQNDHDHRSYVLEVSSLCMHVRGEGGVGVGAGVDGAIVVIVLGKRDPLVAARCCPGDKRWSSSSPKQGRRRTRMPVPRPRSCMQQP